MNPTAKLDLSCSTCLWASPIDEDGLIECRRFPPEVFAVDSAPVQYRPRVHPSDVCGEHSC